MTKTTKIFTLDNKELLLDLQKGVFIPTATTANLINAVRSYINKPGRLLDLGAGSGVVGISLALKELVAQPLCASDLSEGAIECISSNCSRYNIQVDARNGSLLEPWRGEKFDYIVDDISGVAEEAAKLSPWFDNVPCVSGVDGTELTVQVIINATKHLNKGGELFFPIISFSNVEKIVKVAKEHYTNVTLLHREEWPLPKDMYQHISTLKRMRDEGNIQYKDMFGMILCYTDIYVAYN